MAVNEKEAYRRLEECGLRPSVQRMMILEYLLSHLTHPTVEEVYAGLAKRMPTLSRTTVYNTLRLFSEHNVAQMITIDEHRVCYDSTTAPHAHFYCKRCSKIYDIADAAVPPLPAGGSIDGNAVDEVQLYYKGVCSGCAAAGC